MTSWKKAKARLIGFAAISMAASGGCGHGRVLPAPGAQVVPGAPAAAVVVSDGVRVAANADDWDAKPADLPSRVTPVKVRIVNHSGRAVRILYQDFALAGEGGRHYRPLPLLPSEEAEDSRISMKPIYASASFFVGPALQGAYPTLAPWRERLPRDPHFYPRQYKRWGKGLPTAEVRRMGLPEGVLADGGQISGYLYFENATSREDELTFTAALMGADDGEPVTAIELPFRVE